MSLTNVTELVRISNDYEVTIPQKLCEAVALLVGDELEVGVFDRAILLRPKRLGDRPRSTATILDFLQKSHGVQRSKADIDAGLDGLRDDYHR